RAAASSVGLRSTRATNAATRREKRCGSSSDSATMPEGNRVGPGWLHGSMTTSVERRRPSESGALARLTLEELGDATGGIGAVHRAIADRVFRAVGPGAAVVESAHNAVAGGVYTGLRAGARALGGAAERAVPARAVSTT